MSETENFLAQGFDEGKAAENGNYNTDSKGSVKARHIGIVNWIGLKTLYVKEVHRFLKVYTQTIKAPAVTTLVFLAIFY